MSFTHEPLTIPFPSDKLNQTVQTMQRYTNEHNRWTGFNRWTLASLTLTVVLIGSSIGCVSWKHNLRKHSVFASMAQKHDGRYYHCPHCGQIIPQEGNRCPGCFKIPAYHGYEATCWRTFPEGWGCVPETVANNPAFFQAGMLESEMPMEMRPVEAADESADDEADEENEGADDENDGPGEDDAADADVEEIAPPIPDAEPNNSEVQIARLPQNTLAKADAPALIRPIAPRPVTPEPVDPVVESVEAPAEKTVVNEPVAKPQPTKQATSEPKAKQTVAPSIVKSSPKKPITRPAPASSVLTKPAPPAKLPAPVVTPSAPKSVAKETVKVSPKPVVRTKPRPAAPVVVRPTVQSPAIVNKVKKPAAAPKQAQRPTQAGPTNETVSKSAVDRKPFHSVNRIPLPEPKVAAKEIFEAKPSLVRGNRAAIAVPTAGTKPTKVSEAEVEVAEQPEERVSPRDEFGPIPVRKVRLTGLQQQSSINAVKTVATRTVSPVKKSILKKSAPASDLHPAPVRRIGLSELPIKIKP